MIIAAVVIVVIVLVVLAAIRINHRRRPLDGVESFRRHIEALSPAARREVIDRVQNARDSGKGK